MAAPIENATHERDARIRAYINLKNNWDSYGAHPFNPNTIRMALWLSAMLNDEWKVAPCADGPSVYFYRGDEDEQITVMAMK